MHLIETCPKCGHDLTDICYTVYPPIYGKQCFSCGWRSEAEKEQVVRVPYKEKNDSKVTGVLSDYFLIPCNLCNKYFNKDGSCPKEIEKCNGKKHWELLIERISKDESN